MATLGNGQEMMRLRRCLDGVDGDLDVAVRAVLEADRARQPGSQFTVYLGFGSTGPDRAPADQVGKILWADHIEEFGSRRQAQLVDITQQLARHPQAIVDTE